MIGLRKKHMYVAALVVGFGGVVVGCATAVSTPTAEEVKSVLKASFAERGPAKLDRLDQSPAQQLCSAASAAGQTPDQTKKAALENAILQSIPYPADGKYLGDWREGERIAQNGRGMQFSDTPEKPNGGNCYACHQLSPAELSYGNMGPSLQKYGALRGVKDPLSAEAAPVVKYTWARVWNSHAFNACSGMPRFGDAGILSQEQIRHVMALLLDPGSPVNR